MRCDNDSSTCGTTTTPSGTSVRSSHPNELPEPPADARAHSARLVTRIRDEITVAGGMIPFARYMELALYAPGLGYYSAGTHKFGAAGDFVTAPELSPLFARCMARACATVLETLGGGSVLEVGAGSGAFAEAFLAELARRDRLPERYRILEVSADLRARQQERLGRTLPALAERIEWLAAPPREPFTGVVLGNEVLDALPVERFRIMAGSIEQLCVGWENERFVWRARAAPAALAAAVRRIEEELGYRFAEGYESEICLMLPAFVHSCAQALERGLMLWADYGYPRRAYYHPERGCGTLMCHYRQRAHGDPFFWPGLQDITAWVDFTAVAEAATEAGFELLGYTTQAHFLLGEGIAEFMPPPTDEAARRGFARDVKLLTLPEEMGEAFKVIGFTRDLDVALGGFGVRDLAATL